MVPKQRLGPLIVGPTEGGTSSGLVLTGAIGGLLPAGSTPGWFNMVRYRPADATGLRRCIALGQAAEPPEREWQTLRDARSLFNG